ncbi:MAG TPA: hypothetical protein VM307_06300, partial [Egibacteraceae bacterium]|nr:hypothetical protein [Egibacteraceae bacterium]
GLGRVTVSLDALDAEVFAAMSDTAVPVGRVLDGIDAAVTAGLHPVKINSVVRRGVNEDQVVPLARYARERGVTIRFIEYMDVGHTNGWSPADVVPAGEILARVAAAHPLEPSTRDDPSATAVTYRYRDGAGEVGMVASVTQPFCGSCTRARLSPAGELFTCLFASRGTDVRGLLRGGADDDALLDRVGGTWTRRADRYSETRADRRGGRSDRVEMSYIGG